MKALRIATRNSPLALWQAKFVQAALQAGRPGLEVTLLERVTRGDKILDQALSKVGGKDLFVKEIEHALLSGEAQIAVHSLKDMPTDLPEGLAICAYPAREDARDALVSPDGYTVESLPKGARVGTCSLRRAAQILARRPDLEIVPIRGNVQTRLRKLKEENMAATMLAFAGLVRLGLESVASEVLETDVMLPAIGQGILGVETREDDAETNSMVSRLDDADARVAALAERAFLRRLEGGCQVPIAGHTFLEGDQIRIEGLVASVDGKTVIKRSVSGSREEPDSLGTQLGEMILAAGGAAILEALKDA